MSSTARIAGYVAERIADRSTIQVGIGSIPNAILSALADHRDLGIHTELISDGVMDLIEAGAVTGVAKDINRTKTVGTFALGTQRLYDFLDDNTACELWPASYVNDPRVIAQESSFVSINATISVDLLGQCASETIGGTYYSSSGGQADFARGAMYSREGQAFVVLHSTVKDDAISKIVSQLEAGRGGDHAEEHRRPRRHRVGRGVAPRPVDPRAGPGAHRRRPSVPSRPADRSGPLSRVPLTVARRR